MRVRLLFFLILLISLVFGQKQQPGETFKQQFWKHYHSYKSKGVSSFSFYLSSPDFIRQIDQLGLPEEMHYLLKVKWEASGTFTFSYDSLIKKIPAQLMIPIFGKLDTIRNQFWGSTFDMQSLLMENPLNEIPFDAEFWAAGDSVAYQYEILDQGQKITVRKVFLVTNGLYIRQMVFIGNQLISVYPIYEEVENKWQCIGWQTQIMENGKIVGGMEIRFEFIPLENNILFPEKILYIVKTPEKPEEFFVSEIYLYKVQVDMGKVR